MTIEWYCQLMGSELGPYTAVQLVDLARKHRLTPEDLVKKGTAGEWVPAYRVKGLFQAASHPAPAAHAEEAHTNGPSAPHAEKKRPDAERDSPAADDSLHWFCICGGRKHGPVPFTELQSMASQGILQRTDRVWKASAPKWCEAHQVPGLQFTA